MSRLFLAALLLGAGHAASAELIDDFSVSQGPFTVGPGQETSEQEGVLITDSVLGGFRVLIPSLEAGASGGSTVTAGVAAGELFCRIDMTIVNDQVGGGCGSGYDRSDGPLFDLTASNAFEIEILEVTGNAVIAIQVFGPEEEGATGFIFSPTPGTTTVPFSQFDNLTENPLEWGRIDNILVVIATLAGVSGEVVLGRFETDGPIGDGEVVPSDDPPPDSELRDEVYGNFFNPQRSGEGIQLTLENDGETFVLTYYTYLDGEQVWLIGTGALSDGRILFDGMSITEGGDYGDAFDPDDVDFIPWGSIEMSFIDCNRAVLDIAPDLVGFEPFVVEVQRIISAECGAGGPSLPDRVITGNWFDPARSGEGFQLAYEEGRFVLTFYTYQDGKQVWVLGVGDRMGDTLVFPDFNITGGGDFGENFDAADVESEFFGTIEMTLDDCNNATLQIESTLPGFGDQTLDVQKIVPGSCGP